MSSSLRLTLDLNALAENWRSLSDKAFPAECSAVVKADAYGLGMTRVAQTLAAAGCRSFFVTHLEEGLDLRDLLPGVDIYVMNGVPPGEENTALEARLIPVINGLADLKRFKSVARVDPIGLALHIDTGIHRLGLGEQELATLREHRELLAGVKVRLIMSHLVTAETPAHPLNKRQRERFVKSLSGLPSARTSIAASSSIFLDSSYHFDMVRPGGALFGINPTPYASNPMRPVVKLEASILQIHDVAAGETVGYGGDFMLDRPSRIATVSIGYADGIPRRLGNRGHVFVAGHTVPMVGRVSMDLLTIDITSITTAEVRAGDFVELIGPNRPLDEVALEAETIGYDILTSLGNRAARFYMTS